MTGGDQIRARWLWGPGSRLCAWLAITTFVLDQAHKAWMLLVVQLRERGRIPVLPFMDWVYVLNKGISYGLFQQDGQWLLAAFAVLAAAGLWLWAARAATGRLVAASLGLIIGGALGNGLDRILHGGVVDYVLLHAFGFTWYVFNIADAAIVAGVCGLLYDFLQTSRNDASNAA